MTKRKSPLVTVATDDKYKEAIKLLKELEIKYSSLLKNIENL